MPDPGRLIGGELVEWGHIVPGPDLRRTRMPCEICGHPTGDCAPHSILVNERWCPQCARYRTVDEDDRCEECGTAT